jgi:hypothetical protein
MMKTFRRSYSKPVGFYKRGLKPTLRLLNKTTASFEDRLAAVSRRFVGSNYEENPLGGGPDSLELFVVSFKDFDCVTYMETVLALACSKTQSAFFRELRGLRYQNGRVTWFHRNHFMTDWLRRNTERGALANLTRGRNTIKKTRTVSGVPGIQPHEITFRCFQKRSFAKITDRIRTGDLIMFVSTKKQLDVFHTGILIRGGNRILMRHATRSAGKVIEQDVRDFLKSNRMSGFILARPLCRP